MPKALDTAISKCMNAIMTNQGVSADEAKSRCIGRFKKLRIVEQKGKHLGLTKKGKKKMSAAYAEVLAISLDQGRKVLEADDEGDVSEATAQRAAASFLRSMAQLSSDGESGGILPVSEAMTNAQTEEEAAKARRKWRGYAPKPKPKSGAAADQGESCGGDYYGSAPTYVTRTTTFSDETGRHRHRATFDISGSGYTDYVNDHSHPLSLGKILAAAGHVHEIDPEADADLPTLAAKG